MKNGTVYTETVVWSAPERYVADAPYQIAIVDLGERRVTARVLGERVAIGDRVEFVELRDGVAWFRKAVLRGREGHGILDTSGK